MWTENRKPEPVTNINESRLLLSSPIHFKSQQFHWTWLIVFRTWDHKHLQTVFQDITPGKEPSVDWPFRAEYLKSNVVVYLRIFPFFMQKGVIDICAWILVLFGVCLLSWSILNTKWSILKWNWRPFLANWINFTPIFSQWAHIQ